MHSLTWRPLPRQAPAPEESSSNSCLEQRLEGDFVGRRKGTQSTGINLLPECLVFAASRVKAAFLTPTLLMGGAERWLISLARCCDRRRVEWTGTALSLGGIVHPDLCREMSAYMPVYAGPEAGPLQRPDFIHSCSSARAALQAVLRDADVLVTWGLPQLRVLVEGYNRPVVLVSHGDGGGEWGRRTIRSSESGATHLVAVSEAARLAFSPECRDRVTILHNGIDVQRCTPTVSRREMRSLGVRGPSPADRLRRPLLRREKPDGGGVRRSSPGRKLLRCLRRQRLARGRSSPASAGARRFARVLRSDGPASGQRAFGAGPVSACQSLRRLFAGPRRGVVLRRPGGSDSGRGRPGTGTTPRPVGISRGGPSLPRRVGPSHRTRLDACLPARSNTSGMRGRGPTLYRRRHGPALDRLPLRHLRR